MTASFNADVEEDGWKGSRQTFTAQCRETADRVEGATDPEANLCRVMVAAGRQDGRLCTWRNATPSLLIRSIYAWAATSHKWDDRNGWRLRKFESMPTDLIRDAA